MLSGTHAELDDLDNTLREDAIIDAWFSRRRNARVLQDPSPGTMQICEDLQDTSPGTMQICEDLQDSSASTVQVCSADIADVAASTLQRGANGNNQKAVLENSFCDNSQDSSAGTDFNEKNKIKCKIVSYSYLRYLCPEAHFEKFATNKSKNYKNGRPIIGGIFMIEYSQDKEVALCKEEQLVPRVASSRPKQQQQADAAAAAVAAAALCSSSSRSSSSRKTAAAVAAAALCSSSSRSSSSKPRLKL